MGRPRKPGKKQKRKKSKKTKKEIKRFRAGDFVFAKVRGFRAWPARVLREEGKKSRVYFYGTNNVAKVTVGQIFEYEPNKERLGESKKTYALFKNAMKNATYMKGNPDGDDGYFQAKIELEFEEMSNQTLDEVPPSPDLNKPSSPETSSSEESTSSESSASSASSSPSVSPFLSNFPASAESPMFSKTPISSPSRCSSPSPSDSSTDSEMEDQKKGPIVHITGDSD